MGLFTVLLDANILYPAPIRDVFLQLAIENLFRVKWTSNIHREWIEALLRNEPHRSRLTLERTRDLMDMAVSDALITGYESLIETLHLPDPDDRHVLAAAIIGQCDYIITQNLQDFPIETLKEYGVEPQHPDEFLADCLRIAPQQFCAGIHKVRARLKNPPYTVSEYLAILTRLGLHATVSRLEQLTEFLE